MLLTIRLTVLTQCAPDIGLSSKSFSASWRHSLAHLPGFSAAFSRRALIVSLARCPRASPGRGTMVRLSSEISCRCLLSHQEPRPALITLPERKLPTCNWILGKTPPILEGHTSALDHLRTSAGRKTGGLGKSGPLNNREERPEFGGNRRVANC